MIFKIATKSLFVSLGNVFYAIVIFVQTIWDQITTPVPNGRQVKHHSIVGHATFCGQEEARYDPAARKAEQDEIV